MSVNVTVNGIAYAIPVQGEVGWATAVTTWIQGISGATLQKSGGTFTLTADTDFGSSFGLKSNYYYTRTGNASTTGVLRLASLEGIGWRNAANSADVLLSKDSADQLLWNGSAIVQSTALTASRAMITGFGGLYSVSATTSTEIGFVSGVTSAIQTQLNSKTFANLSPLTTKGDLVGFSTVPARVAVGSDGTFLKADSSAATGVSWASASANLVVASKTSNYTLIAGDDLVLGSASGGTFTLTLPTAVGVTGKVYRLKKTDSTFTAIAIATTSSQTIDGVTTSSLNTQYEELTVVSDGANWQVVARTYPQGWISETPTGTMTTNCTYTGYYRRVGDTMWRWVHIAFSGAPTSTTLTLTTPTGIAIDTSKQNTSGASYGSGLCSLVISSATFTGVLRYNSSTAIQPIVYAVSGTHVDTGVITQATPGTIATGNTFDATYWFPVSGWNG